ncbi:aminopeptidase N [Corynebacterium flavescens]|uniref:Aminopeptidase N n=1 Tax=Corynebacterium flavescens TaxID=28028 RepID=A0A1L7CQ10_CORFL|nr:aminopeptidase N [Corynebacterium flavescens]APT87942.1 aminopeptidase N [Corynebacterium flavescens]KAA8719568.1 aminopeptidase N [Corynebacterium flavescens]GEB97465.1 aminopeptidase [Corynebacterium flavescens]
MTYANLTQAQAQERSLAIELSAYHVDLDLSAVRTHDTFPVHTRVELRTESPELFLDYLGTSVESLLINGSVQSPHFEEGRLYLHHLPVEEDLVIEVSGTSSYSRTGQGLHRMFDRADDTIYLYSHLEPSDARRIFPCFDQPDLKARFYVRMLAPQEWQILSNQPVATREIEGDFAWVTFHPTPPLSTYLTAFAAGPYVSRTRSWTSPDGFLDIKLSAFSRASMAQYVDHEILDITAAGLDFFHESFGFPYPWGEYKSIFVPEYNIGAMENPGLVTFTETYLFRSQATRSQHAARTNTILHEMSHMWFGDLVTPRWWDDLWLKESFAEFMGADSSVAATDYSEAWTNFAGQRKNWAYMQDQLPTTHPIKADIPDVDAARQNFDGITYAKGAAVLKQLVHYVGRENFYAGARDYFAEHAYSAATFDDLLTALKGHSDRDLDAWSRSWLRTCGPDTLTPHLETVGGKISRLSIVAEAAEETRPHRLVAALYDDALEKYASFDVDLPAAGTETTIEEAAGLARPALVLLNEGDYTYAKVRFDATSLETLRAGLSRIDDELSRAVVWTALWNLTRDGLWPVREYVGTVVEHAIAESNPTLLTTALANARFAITNFLPATAREATRVSYADDLWAILRDAAPGSDAQLVLARASIAALADSPADTATQRLRELLAGELSGLRLDPDIRWALLRALSARDAVSTAELDAGKERDYTLTGQAAHLGAIHSFPKPEHKREVFDLLLSPGAFSNAEIDSLLQAFNAPRSQSLREPFAAEYFSRLDEIWKSHPIEIANRLVRGLYPGVAQADAATTDFLAQDPPQALRRILLECQDNLRRALRVRALN